MRLMGSSAQVPKVAHPGVGTNSPDEHGLVSSRSTSRHGTGESRKPSPLRSTT